MLKWLWLSVVIVVLDQATKLLASQYLELHQPVSLLPMLNLTLMHNTGAAFSLLSEAGGWQRWLFTGLALVIGAFIIGWLRKLEAGQTWLAVALALILGGALGNVWDRATLGYVVDFIDVYYGRWHWPAFNIADAAISVGAVILVIDSFRGHRRT
ncbi:signal peptidase II [Thiohalomonas denitrificans]|uniref:signal peptidase II n=1 Tax=Thiohalomonas denitrificans TaxID=415747 RepID=UPI0026F262E1|nr:signal peptidase II [Thiohalomonas denitrificans]